MINTILFILFHYGCIIQDDPKIIKKQQSIVITIRNKPEIDCFFYITPKIFSKTERLMSLYDGNPITSNEIHIQATKFPKSIKVSVENEFIILKHQINALDINEYLIEKGDSVEIKYVNKQPIVSITNREVKLYDYAIESIVNSPKKSEKYSFFGSYFNVSSLHIQKIFNDKSLKSRLSSLSAEQKMRKKYEIESQIKSELYRTNKFHLKTIISQIDSLYRNNLLSENQFRFYLNKYKGIEDIIEIENEGLSNNQIQEKLRASIVRQNYYSNIYHQKLVEAIEDKLIIPKIAFLDLKDFVNKDYRIAYQVINNSTLFKDEDKNYLLFREIDRIAQSFSNKDFLEYFSLFEKDIVDTTYINYIKNKYELKFNDKKNETNSLVLMSSDKKQLSLDELKKRHAGKLIYVDFWASWCAPCRKALPSSIKLKDKNKDVVFVYLSMDSTVEPWQKAMNAEGLSNYAESYIIVNPETSNFLKKQNVSVIPRYMIFDKKGVLAFANAPSAESKELENTFTKLLK